MVICLAKCCIAAKMVPTPIEDNLFDALKCEISLKQILPAMGMPTAFSGMADFSGMTGNKDLFIGDVLHEAFVSVDEAGTEAAAASAVIMKLTAAEEMVTMSLDSPFIFLIRDIQTGTVLFIGRVLNPKAE